MNNDSDFKSIRHYFVDEAGDGVIYNSKGKVIVGKDGCSRYFMLGILDVPDPTTLSIELDTLRQNLLRGRPKRVNFPGFGRAFDCFGPQSEAIRHRKCHWGYHHLG